VNSRHSDYADRMGRTPPASGWLGGTSIAVSFQMVHLQPRERIFREGVAVPTLGCEEGRSWRCIQSGAARCAPRG
jgi:hypothetical protein